MVSHMVQVLGGIYFWFLLYARKLFTKAMHLRRAKEPHRISTYLAMHLLKMAKQCPTFISHLM